MSTFRERPQDRYVFTPAAAARAGRQGGVTSGVVRSERARLRAVQVARDAIQAGGQSVRLSDVLLALYQRGYQAGKSARWRQRQRERVA